MSFGGIGPSVAAVVIAANASKNRGGSSQPPDDDEKEKEMKFNKIAPWICVAAFIMVIVITVLAYA